jgi:hypothetical protein
MHVRALCGFKASARKAEERRPPSVGRMAIGARQRRGAHPPHRPPIRAYVWAIAVCLIEGESLNVLVTMPGHFIAALGNYA